MDEEVILAAEACIGYCFNDKSILIESFTHASLTDDRRKSNERMEFLGDAILGMVVCEHLFTTYPDLLEGDLTKIKSSTVSRRACAEVATASGLDAFLMIGKGMSNRHALPQSLAAAVFESVIAAVHMDGGLEPAKAFILKCLTPLIEQAERSGHQHNFKSLLQQVAQEQFDSPANYILLEENGPDHAKCFNICVEIANEQYEAKWAPSKKQAEQAAALCALLELGIAKIDPDTDEVYVPDDRNGLSQDECVKITPESDCD